MAIRKFPSLHYTSAERKLFVTEKEWRGFTTTVKIIAEVILVFSFIGLVVIIKDNDPHVSAVGLEWLDNKRVVKSSARRHVENVFNIGKEMDTQSAVFSFTFENDFADVLFPV